MVAKTSSFSELFLRYLRLFADLLNMPGLLRFDEVYVFLYSFYNVALSCVALTLLACHSAWRIVGAR